MKILMTGSDGFIGSHMKERLGTNHEIIPLKGDLRNHDAIREEIRNAQPDVIVHLAARTEVEKSFYEQTTFSDINYTGTVNLIECARQEVPNLQNFVFASTMEVYGWQPVSDTIRTGMMGMLNGDDFEPYWIFDENTPPNPNAPYAVAKYGCEKYLEYVGRSFDFPFTVLRQTNTYGRKDNNFFVVEQMIYQMLTRENVEFGYGTPYRNFIWIEDLLDAWEAVIENPDKVKGELFCVGPPNAIQIERLAQVIAEKIGFTGEIQWHRKRERPGEIWLLNSSHGKLTSMLGWEPKVSLEEGLDKTIEIWRDILSNNKDFKNDF